MRKLFLLIPGYCLIWLSGCLTAVTPPKATLVTEVIETRSITDNATATPAAFTRTPSLFSVVLSPPVTSTFTPTTPSPNPGTPTPNLPSEAKLQIRQMKFFTAIPEGNHWEGYAVLVKALENSAVIIDLTTLAQSRLVLHSQYLKDELGILSPDEKWLVRLKSPEATGAEDWEYEVVSEQGKIQRVFSLPQDWLIRYTWVSNQQILADKRREPNVEVYQTIAISPLTGEKHALPFDYPNIYDMFTMHSYNYNVYDPSLHYVIYPASLPNVPPGQILRDVTKRKNVLTLPAAFQAPSWSPDGKMFAIGSNTYIFGGYLDGQVKNLTHVEQYNGASIGEGGDVIRWSPDGHKIAFSMSSSPHPTRDDSHCLAILEVETETVTDYCVPGFDIKSNILAYPIVWAANSHQLLVQGIEISKRSEPHTLFIDLETETAVDLGEQMEPLYLVSTLPAVWMK